MNKGTTTISSVQIILHDFLHVYEITESNISTEESKYQSYNLKKLQKKVNERQ
jgi:hypothetical protein